MDFDLTQEQRMLVQTIRDFIAAELFPLEKEVEESGILDPEKARCLLYTSPSPRD